MRSTKSPRSTWTTSGFLEFMWQSVGDSKRFNFGRGPKWGSPWWMKHTHSEHFSVWETQSRDGVLADPNQINATSAVVTPGLLPRSVIRPSAQDGTWQKFWFAFLVHVRCVCVRMWTYVCERASACVGSSLSSTVGESGSLVGASRSGSSCQCILKEDSVGGWGSVGFCHLYRCVWSLSSAGRMQFQNWKPRLKKLDDDSDWK